MDKEIYPLKEVGDVYNRQFISVKVQMDKTDKDDSLVKKWYRDAASLQLTYTVSSFPTFLFFSPDGKPMHKIAATKSPNGFIELAKDAQNPDKQYYSILKNYMPGKLDTAELKGLANSFKYSDKVLTGRLARDYFDHVPLNELGNDANLNFMIGLRDIPEVQGIVANYFQKLSRKLLSSSNYVQLVNAYNKVPQIQSIILDYLTSLSHAKLKQKGNLGLLTIFKNEEQVKIIADHYIKRLSPKKTYTKENLQFISNFIASSKDIGFYIFYHNVVRVDNVMENNHYANYFIDRVITNEEIKPFTDSSKKNGITPKWETVRDKITKKYGGEDADRTVLNAQIGWFAKRSWPEMIKYMVVKFDRYGLDSIGAGEVINSYNALTIIFEHSSDKMILEQAINWMESLWRNNPTLQYGLIDTYAGLLYKVDRFQEAIKMQEKSVKEFIENYKGNQEDLDKNKYYIEIKEILLGMRNGMEADKIWIKKRSGE